MSRSCIRLKPEDLFTIKVELLFRINGMETADTQCPVSHVKLLIFLFQKTVFYAEVSEAGFGARPASNGLVRTMRPPKELFIQYHRLIKDLPSVDTLHCLDTLCQVKSIISKESKFSTDSC